MKKLLRRLARRRPREARLEAERQAGLRRLMAVVYAEQARRARRQRARAKRREATA